MCGHEKWCGAILALLIIVFSFWQTMYSKWIIVIAAVLILVHSSWHGSCCEAEGAKPKAKKKKK